MGSLFTWLMQQIGDYFDSLATWVLGRVEAAWSWFVDTIGLLFDFMWNFFVVSRIPDEWYEALLSYQYELQQLTPYLADVTWILPVVPALAIIGTALSACGIIRLLRWVKSFIPTISGA